MKFSYKENAGVSLEEIQQTVQTLLPYFAELKNGAQDAAYTHAASFLHLPYDEDYIQKIVALASQKDGEDLKHIFLVGIGGSNLGARAIYEAYAVHETFLAHAPEIHFLDTINTPFLESLPHFFDTHMHTPNECIILYISKSGTTTESAANFEYLADVFTKKFSKEDLAARTIAITDEDSPLWKESIAKGVATIAIPKPVGGRYSVFSAVGLLPLALCGVPINDVLKEAREAQEESLKEITEENPALISAAILFHYLRAGYAVHNTFLFATELESLGRWYRQLSAESLGKGGALLPEIAVGSTDLHSTAQLYLEGPKNRVTTFVWLAQEGDVTITNHNTLETVQGIAGKKPESIRTAIYEGIKRSYAKESLPFMELALEGPASCGAFMAMKMIETLLLAHLVNVNPFDQPAVESYKEETRRILGSL